MNMEMRKIWKTLDFEFSLNEVVDDDFRSFIVRCWLTLKTLMELIGLKHQKMGSHRRKTSIVDLSY